MADSPPPPVLSAPVPGAVSRGFTFRPNDPFARGAHRGADIPAPAGTAARAPCRGRVTHAGATPAGQVVTLRCGAWSATLVGVAPSVARAASVRRGAVVGRVSGRPPAPARGGEGAHGGQAGLHLGLRRAGDPFGYVDPARRIRVPPVAPVAPPVVAPRGPRAAAPRIAPVPRPSAPPRAQPRPAAAPGLAGIPWPAWLGVSLLAAVLGIGAAGRVRALRPRHTGARAAAPTMLWPPR